MDGDGGDGRGCWSVGVWSWRERAEGVCLTSNSSSQVPLAIGGARGKGLNHPPQARLPTLAAENLLASPLLHSPAPNSSNATKWLLYHRNLLRLRLQASPRYRQAGPSTKRRQVSFLHLRRRSSQTANHRRQVTPTITTRQQKNLDTNVRHSRPPRSFLLTRHPHLRRTSPRRTIPHRTSPRRTSPPIRHPSILRTPHASPSSPPMRNSRSLARTSCPIAPTSRTCRARLLPATMAVATPLSAPRPRPSFPPTSLKRSAKFWARRRGCS